MSPALEELIARAAPEDEVEAFFTSNEFPLVDGDHVTFVYRGEADAVNLRHWIFGLESRQPLVRLRRTDLWTRTIELPRGSRVEYKFEVVRDDNVRWLLDPLNDRRAHDPFGSNSVCYGAGYESPDWALEHEATRKGTIETLVLHSNAFRDERVVRLYLPARFRRRARYPLLVTHDGDDYLRFSGLQTVLDNLIHQLEIPSMIVAMTNPRDRLTEYADDERNATFLVDELLPFLGKKLPLVDNPTARGLAGASFGAVATLSCAVRRPGVFGKLLLQSGSFAFTDIGEHHRGPAFDPVVAFMNRFRAKPSRTADRMFVSCGMYESLIYENRSMVPLLQRTGADVRYVEARDGHNWENWRDRMREGLSWLFPGPLWMVYE